MKVLGLRSHNGLGVSALFVRKCQLKGNDCVVKKIRRVAFLDYLY